MPTDARGFERTEKPDGPLSGVFWEYDRRLTAVRTHAAFEGHDVDLRGALRGYDRALHPWMHGRRPADLAERYGDLLERIGFAVGLVLGAILYVPWRVAKAVRGWAEQSSE